MSEMRIWQLEKQMRQVTARLDAIESTPARSDTRSEMKDQPVAARGSDSYGARQPFTPAEFTAAKVVQPCAECGGRGRIFIACPDGVLGCAVSHRGSCPACLGTGNAKEG